LKNAKKHLMQTKKTNKRERRHKSDGKKMWLKSAKVKNAILFTALFCLLEIASPHFLFF